MLNFLKSVVKHPAFKEVLRLVLAALAGASASGCGALASVVPNQAQLDVYECQVAAVVEYIPPAAAEDVVMALRNGSYEYAVKQLLAFGLDVERIRALADAYDACSPAPEPAPAAPEAPELLRS